MAGCVRAQEAKSIDEEATHVDTGKISVAEINAFCLTGSDQIVAACGTGPGQIRILTADGEEVLTWDVDFKPEAVETTPDGDVLVGGEGQLRRFSIEGELLNSAESPHVVALRENTDKLREAAIEQLSSRGDNLESTVQMYKQLIAQLEDKKEQGELSDQEERILESLPESLKQFEEQLAQQQERAQEDEPSEAEIERLVDGMLNSKKRIASISTDGAHTFVATGATVGYGYDIWKMSNDFSQGEQIVTGLRGCCGQMDAKCCEEGIYVAENSRHRVVCFDQDGEQKLEWGKSDRTGIDGFTSCCNPMNVCFSSNGDVFTAESTTGRIKRFSADGELLAYVGDVKLVPGCKNVSIDVSSDGSRVYMLDITRGHIVVMSEKTAAEQPVSTITRIRSALAALLEK
jgi:WD40 repeat protein